MNIYTQFHPISTDLIVKISTLKTIMYSNALWGLYHQGWAIKSDADDFIFPFWLNSVQAYSYAKKYWPHYTPKKITPDDFQLSLLPTLTRLSVAPALFHCTHQKFKLSTQQMHHFFFRKEL